MSIYELITRFSNYNKCRSGLIWCTDGSFIDPLMYRESGKTAYGYALTDDKVVSLKRSKEDYLWNKAELYCTKCKNAGKSGYLPNIDELTLLHTSIKLGRMRTELIKAGIYEECNYRFTYSASLSEPSWWYVWSRDELDSSNAYDVNYFGNVEYFYKSCYNYVIPFFKF